MVWACESVSMRYKTTALSKFNVILFPGFGPNLILEWILLSCFLLRVKKIPTGMIGG